MYDRLGIAADGIIVDETIHSGVSVILIDAAGNNLISVVPGANLRLSIQDLDRFDEVFRNSAIVGFQLENGPGAMRARYRPAKGARHEESRPFSIPLPAVRLADDMLRCVDYLKPTLRPKTGIRHRDGRRGCRKRTERRSMVHAGPRHGEVPRS